MPFGWPIEEFREHRSDVERASSRHVALAPEFEARVRAAKRESKFVGTAQLPGYFRKPFGHGWALVGDAGYHKNPITAMGINDAFRDAELLADAVDDAFSRRRGWARRWRLPAGARRRRDAGLRVHRRVRPAPPAAAGAAAADRRDARQPGGDGRLRQRAGRDAPRAGVLRPAERRADHGSGLQGCRAAIWTARHPTGYRASASSGPPQNGQLARSSTRSANQSRRQRRHRIRDIADLLSPERAVCGARRSGPSVHETV